jgi:excisionase family DNA binding protein
MHTNVKQIELTDTSVPLAPSRTMYHKPLSVPLENQPDINYLFRQLDENEFLGAMKTKRIIRYSPWTDFTAVETFDFHEEVSLPNTLGQSGRLIPPFTKAQYSHSREDIESIISPAGIMKITRHLDLHDVIVMNVPVKHRLSDIVIDATCSMDMILGKEDKRHILLYWFTMGHSGIFKMTAKVIKDDENFLAKLKANLDDVPMRDYLVQRSLAGSRLTIERIEKVPERMNHEEAASYLRMPKSTLYDKVGTKKIKRVKSGKRNLYMKEDLDAYLRREKNK